MKPGGGGKRTSASTASHHLLQSSKLEMSTNLVCPTSARIASQQAIPLLQLVSHFTFSLCAKQPKLCAQPHHCLVSVELSPQLFLTKSCRNLTDNNTRCCTCSAKELHSRQWHMRARRCSAVCVLPDTSSFVECQDFQLAQKPLIRSHTHQPVL